jgi:hypothetical protein
MIFQRQGRMLLLLAAASSLPGPAQENRFELGALGLFGGYRSADVKSGPVAGSVGFALGPGAGALFGQDMHEHVGGEIRYLFSKNNMKLSSGGISTEFASRSHILNYDLLIHTSGRDAHVRPFIAAGGGLKVYQGTGAEQAFQPLINLALLTRTREPLPTVDFGGGVKVRLSDGALLRVEFRDYITKVPKTFEPSPGARISGLLHHWLAAVGVSWTF